MPKVVGGVALLPALYFLFQSVATNTFASTMVRIQTDFFMAVRIIGEERMLVNELEGYGDYKKKVRYRLIPFVW